MGAFLHAMFYSEDETRGSMYINDKLLVQYSERVSIFSKSLF